MDGETQSQWTNSMGFCEELYQLRISLHGARLSGDIVSWYNCLVSYYLCLSARFKDRNTKGKITKSPMREKHEQFYEKATAAVSDYNSRTNSFRPSYSTPKIPFKVITTLHKWELELRKNEDQLGLLVKDVADSRYALGK